MRRNDIQKRYDDGGRGPSLSTIDREIRRAEVYEAANPDADMTGYLWTPDGSHDFPEDVVEAWYRRYTDPDAKAKAEVTALEAANTADAATLEIKAARLREIEREVRSATAPDEAEIAALEERRYIEHQLSDADAGRLAALKAKQSEPGIAERAKLRLKSEIDDQRDRIRARDEKITASKQAIAIAQLARAGELTIPRIVTHLRQLIDVESVVHAEPDGFLHAVFDTSEYRIVIKSARQNAFNTKPSTSLVIEGLYLGPCVEAPEPESDPVEPVPSVIETDDAVDATAFTGPFAALAALTANKG